MYESSHACRPIAKYSLVASCLSHAIIEDKNGIGNASFCNTSLLLENVKYCKQISLIGIKFSKYQYFGYCNDFIYRHMFSKRMPCGLFSNLSTRLSQFDGPQMIPRIGIDNMFPCYCFFSLYFIVDISYFNRLRSYELHIFSLHDTNIEKK